MQDKQYLSFDVKQRTLSPFVTILNQLIISI